MPGVQVLRPIDDALATATMKVSQSHMLLSGIMESELPPDVQVLARTHLETLESALTDLRDVAVSLGARRPE